MKTIFSTLTLCLLFTLHLTAQGSETARRPANPGSELRAYPADTRIQGEAMQRFAAFFEPMNVGFLHVYADPNVDPAETYLLRGKKLGGVALQVLPGKYRRMASRMDADVYGAGAIRGNNENLYLVRMDGDTEDRVEMFAIRGNEVEHLKTLARFKRQGSRTKQIDTFITDIDGNSYLDLMTVKARRDGTMGKQTVYILNETGTDWEKTNELDAPWDSASLYKPSMDN